MKDKQTWSTPTLKELDIQETLSGSFVATQEIFTADGRPFGGPS